MRRTSGAVKPCSRIKEQKIFQGVLWAFLVGSLIFFIARLSAGAIFLPLPIWCMFLLITAGFIIFIFVPHAGRGMPGLPGRHEETIESYKWYPRDLGEIVERRPNGTTPAREGVRPRRTPCPRAPRSAPASSRLRRRRVQERSSREEMGGAGGGAASKRLRQGAERAREDRSLAVELGERTSDETDWGGVEHLTGEERAALIRRLDARAESTGLRGVPFPEVGIQVFSSAGERIAWGGSPRYLEGEYPGAPAGTRIFTGRTPLYTLLVCEVHAPGKGRVIVDIPLEVNYRINNRFLHSTSLGEVLSRRFGVTVEFAFSMGEHRGVIGWSDPSLSRSDVTVLSSANAGVQVIGVVQASTGAPLARLKVLGDPYAASVREAETRRARWAGLLLSIAAVVIAVWVFRAYFKKPAGAGERFRILLLRILVLASSIVVIRFLLLRLGIPGALIGTPVQHVPPSRIFPGRFHAERGGLPRVVHLRAHPRVRFDQGVSNLLSGAPRETARRAEGVQPRALRGQGRTHLRGDRARHPALLGRRVAYRVQRGAPRLVGPDVNFLDVPVIGIHLSLLFMVSAILIAALFIARLALVWGGGRLGEGLAASAIALAGLAFLHAGQWPLICVAAGLVALAFRIFPLLRKEETVSIIFASFFLVIICSLAVYAVSNERYVDLWKGYVREKAAEFDKPGDNWMQLYLPDICSGISSDPAMTSRIASRKESAAFEIWAESSLSRGGLSCVFEVYDAAGALLSRFAVGMPIELPHKRPDPARLKDGAYVASSRVETPNDAVFYYSGYAPVFHASGAFLGWVEITIPYFFENPELLAHTGEMAPEILQNIEPGRRSDKPERLLVARVAGDRVMQSSEPALREGSVLPARPGEWLTLRPGRDLYDCAVKLGTNGEGYLVGYRVAGGSENLLQWATVVSFDVILTLLSLVALFVLRRLPVLKGVVPDVSPGRSLGFRQKVLLSFLLVSILPVVILGIFSSQVIARRFRVEEENKALLGAKAAVSLINHSIRTEAASLASGQYIGELLAREGKGSIPVDTGVDTRRFTVIGSDGEELLRERRGRAHGSRSSASLLTGSNIGRVTVSYESPVLYGGLVVPIVSHGDRGGYLYYRRALDDDFVKSVALALNAEINIYYGALIQASSERELFVGGFLDPICPSPVFADIAIEADRAAVRRETLGDYSYYVEARRSPASAARRAPCCRRRCSTSPFPCGRR